MNIYIIAIYLYFIDQCGRLIEEENIYKDGAYVNRKKIIFHVQNTFNYVGMIIENSYFDNDKLTTFSFCWE